tara:strand:+ start:480 stop:677 length:198 start_codon:yes stop_codon:yes gene_type:complete
MARPRLKKNKYVVELTPVSNFKVIYYGDDEEPEAEWVEAEWSAMMRRIIRHNEEKTGSPEFVLNL